MPRSPSLRTVPYEVAESPIHGRGVFATRALRKGMRIGTFTGRPTKRNGPHVLWVQDEAGVETGIRGTGALRFLNHAARPNAAFEGVELWSCRAIRRGEEITIDYGPAWRDG